MAETERPEQAIEWHLTTWDGAQREQMRRWAELPLENIIRALEEMEQVAAQLAESSPLNSA